MECRQLYVIRLIYVCSIACDSIIPKNEYMNTIIEYQTRFL